MARPGKSLTAKALTNGKKARIIELRRQDWLQCEIAAEVMVSQSYVSQVLHEHLSELHGMPREVQLRERLEQAEAKISYWEAIVEDEARPWYQRKDAAKEVRWWYDFRARLCAEYAPAAVFHSLAGQQDGQVVRYVIEDAPELEGLR